MDYGLPGVRWRGWKEKMKSDSLTSYITFLEKENKDKRSELNRFKKAFWAATELLAKELPCPLNKLGDKYPKHKLCLNKTLCGLFDKQRCWENYCLNKEGEKLRKFHDVRDNKGQFKKKG